LYYVGMSSSYIPLYGDARNIRELFNGKTTRGFYKYA
jgi:hypothetical protein